MPCAVVRQEITLFIDLIQLLADHRRIIKGNIRPSLQDIFLLTLAAVASGCTTWGIIEEYGNLKLNWFRKYFLYKYGIASHDTLEPFFGAFDRNNFANFFMDYTQKLTQKDSRVVAIDGKTD